MGDLFPDHRYFPGGDGKPPKERPSWPDPEPGRGQNPLVDDVSRLNAEEVAGVFCVRTVDDVKAVLVRAHEEGKSVSCRGTRHSMGGQCIAPNGFVIDLMLLNSFSFNEATKTVTTQPGATWADLIKYLNQWGYSPRTMQSYSTFSVGGSLAVNAHGITTDHGGAESVIRFTLVKWDGSEVVCERGAPGESGELFGLALGGYGMFGIMVEVTLKVNENVHLYLETIQTDVAHFPGLYEEVLLDKNSDIEIKLARLNIITCEAIDLFVFKRDQRAGMRTMSKIGHYPREMGVQQQLLYKWIMPSFKAERYAYEASSGQAIDWSEENERNLLMYESAIPLARMYTLLYEVSDTFILQVSLP